MLEAVQTIHEEKIVHSDLKPANFVLVKGSLKLIDFGIAKTIANNRTNIQRKHQVGILNYMSPESIEETQTANGRRLKLGHASDVWSPGCILYQMIYSQPPFCSITGTVPKLRAISNPNRIINYPTKPVPTVPASDKEGARQILEWATPVPLDVVNTLKGCLTRDPKQQNTTASQLKVPKLKESEVILTEAWMKQIIKHASKEAIENGALDEEAVQKIAQVRSLGAEEYFRALGIPAWTCNPFTVSAWFRSAPQALWSALQAHQISSLRLQNPHQGLRVHECSGDFWAPQSCRIYFLHFD
ncbi:Serine/threonine-protein kinase mph1 OS=Schizosaccharomyces pombe (strain 972 / ATCC 24843) GN=mph1 PE=2 SV=1 [Rhizoctonia solani AG-1 IB]|uniref:Serine/threonine-protein kinase mph1 n=1 Tax=Thanatephorus cucumeris (strain AG1-IB / isolate 7/3/14) TaxID=1108050 RepID=A0A0B7FGJ8_THACB|nr:Serine/threonine-protein kinase mph1 OS=Schizosaccharomyces pombe (strain 972 / ATCC 24843) GN=mph1 PE=2 SV=1 [Rhizoctonia solani AG-1 IB]